MSLFTCTGVVTWSETDASGRYHNTAAYLWAENAEHTWCRLVMPGVDIARFPRRASSASYERPLSAGDGYTVELDAERFGTTSITYTWTVIGPDGVCARGRHTVVHLGPDGRPAAVPAALRASARRARA